MRKLLLAGAIVLAGCASTEFTLEQSTAIACRGYASTLSAITPFKPRMTPEQVDLVNRSNEAVIDSCENVGAGVQPPTEALLQTVRDHLREMLLLEQQMKDTV